MDGYVNNITLVDSGISQILIISVTCPLCENIYIDPVICKCKNIYCKACIDDWIKKNKKCPNKCKKPNYQKCNEKNDILSKLKFRCLGCQKEILYFDAKSHHKSCCPDKKISKIKKIDKETINAFRNYNDGYIRTIKGKKILILFILLYSDNSRGFLCWKI